MSNLDDADGQRSKPRRFDRDVNGILLLDKPLGLSSNAALQQVRALFRARKAGHAGSLDPLASGVLPLCFGEATKVCGNLLDAFKTYVFVARLGQRTDTGDAEGHIVEEKPIPTLTEAAVCAVLQANLGEQKQVPPMYSALKHQGERLYSLARRGETVERSPRLIVIESLRLLRLNAHDLEVEVRCSKGTYVRTLAEDLAVQLGTIAHLIALRRIAVDPFSGRTMYTLAELADRAATEPNNLSSLLISSDQALSYLPAIELDATQCEAVLQGQLVRPTQAPPVSTAGSKMLRLYGPVQRFLGVGEVTSDGRIQPKRLIKAV